MTLLSPCCCSLKNNFGQVFQFCIKFNKSKAIETHFALYVSGVSSLGVPGVPWHTHRPVASGGAVGALAPPVFGQSVNPISTRGGKLCPPQYYQPPRIFRPCDGPEPQWPLKLQQPHSITDNVLKEDLENTTGLLIDQASLDFLSSPYIDFKGE